MGLIYATILAIFFPIYIQFLGKDALTTGTVFILILYIYYLYNSFLERNFIKEPFDYLVYILILMGAISLILPILTGEMKGGRIGNAVRQYTSFASSLLLFIAIKNIVLSKKREHIHDMIDKLLVFIMALISIHIVISLVVDIYPRAGSLFKVFLPRNFDPLDLVERGKEMGRVGSFVFTPEKYGEILAALSPIVIYKIYKSKNSFWFFIFFLFALGLMHSVTRSGIILFVGGVFLSILYNFKSKPGKTIILSNFFFVTAVAMVFYSNTLLDDIYIRFADAATTYNNTGNVIATLNRSRVFYPAWNLVVSKLTFFGNGITDFHFHDLYLTNIYQLGIIGSLFFSIVFLSPIVKLLKSLKTSTHENKKLIFACILSLILFLINETKFEFIRDSSYQQIWWGLLATYYLVSQAETYNDQASEISRTPYY